MKKYGLAVLLLIVIVIPNFALGESLHYVGSTLWTGINDVEVNGSYAYCAMVNGVMIIDVTDRATPVYVSRLYINGPCEGIAVSPSVGYLAAGYEGLQIISPPDNPVLVGSLDLDGYAYEVAVSGSYAYLACYDAGLKIVDISNLTTPTLAATYSTNMEHVTDICLSGNYAYLTDENGELHIVDISTPTSPSSVVDYAVPNGCRAVHVDGNYAYIGTAAYSVSFEIIDITVPATPALAGSLDTGGWTRDVHASGNYAFVANDFYFRTINVTNPASPFIAANSSAMSDLRSIFYDGANYCYLSNFKDALQIIQVTAPTVPVEIGNYALESNSYVYDTHVVGNNAYTAGYLDGLRTLDITDKANPTILGQHDTVEPVRGLFVVDNTAYLADDDTTMIIVNVTDPSSLSRLATADTTGIAWDVAVDGNYAYVAGASPGLQVYDISTLSSPSSVGSYTSSDLVMDVFISGSYAYLANYAAGLIVLNITDPSNPTETGTLDTYRATGVYISGIFAYVADDTAGLKIISVNNPASPVLISSFDTDGYAYDVFVSGTHAIVADGLNGVLAIDISNQATPTLVAHYDTPGNAKRVFVDNDYVYVSDYYSMIILTFNPSAIDDGFTRLPGTYSLSQNYPNPFNAATKISFGLKLAGDVSVDIFDIGGRKVHTIPVGYLSDGYHDVIWDASGFSSGIYFYQISAGNFNATGKMTLLK